MMTKVIGGDMFCLMSIHHQMKSLLLASFAIKSHFGLGMITVRVKNGL